MSQSPDSVLSWIDESDLAAVASSTFWNDEEKEKEKPYYVTGRHDAAKLWTYLRETTSYYEQFEYAVRMAERLGVAPKGVGVDLAAGVCWTTALLSQIPEVDRVYAVEISKHRLTLLAPNVCDALDAQSDKIVRVLGSFYDVRLPDSSVDFCMMSQSFHHADEPLGLLAELRRILKPGSPTLIIGEDPIYPSTNLLKRLKNVAKIVVPRRFYIAPPVYKMFPRFQELFPTDLETGDHYYRIRDYRRMFEAGGFTLHQSRSNGFTVFVAIRNA